MDPCNLWVTLTLRPTRPRAGSPCSHQRARDDGFIIAFLVAVIFAANQNDVVGWVVAVIALFWLLLASFVVFSIQKAAKKAGAKLTEAQNAFNAAAGAAQRARDSLHD